MHLCSGITLFYSWKISPSTNPCIRIVFENNCLHHFILYSDKIGELSSILKVFEIHSVLKALVTRHHFDGLVEDCSNSIANAMELLQSSTNPSTYWLYPMWSMVNHILNENLVILGNVCFVPILCLYSQRDLICWFSYDFRDCFIPVTSCTLWRLNIFLVIIRCLEFGYFFIKHHAPCLFICIYTLEFTVNMLDMLMHCHHWFR